MATANKNEVKRRATSTANKAIAKRKIAVSESQHKTFTVRASEQNTVLSKKETQTIAPVSPAPAKASNVLVKLLRAVPSNKNALTAERRKANTAGRVAPRKATAANKCGAVPASSASNRASVNLRVQILREKAVSVRDLAANLAEAVKLQASCLAA